MSRIFLRLPLLALFSLSLLTACSSRGPKFLGNPERPYPLPAKPEVGQFVHLPTGVAVTTPQLFAVAGDARIVYVGESHDNMAAHRLELQLLQGLSDRHPGRQALGMEMFVRSQQPALDRWVQGLMDEKTFLKESRWYDNWQADFGYYRDLLLFARERKIPVIALKNEKIKPHKAEEAPATDAAAQTTPPELDLTDPYQRALVASIYADHLQGEMALDRFVRAQTVWDETMAESVADYLASPGGQDKHLLVVTGDYHVRHGFGVPRRAFRRLPASYVIVGGEELETPGKKQRERLMMDVDLPHFPMVPYDFLAYIGSEALPVTGVRLGVAMEPATGGKGLVVKQVMPDSNAERAGLKTGDLLLALDGEPLVDNMDLIYPLKQKKPGEHGILKIERQGVGSEVDVLFKPVTE